MPRSGVYGPERQAGGLSRQRTSSHTQRFGPKCGGGMGGIHHIAQGGGESFQLQVRHHERRRGFQNHEVVATHLGKESVIAKEAHHHDLAEHAGMDLPERLKGSAQFQFARRAESDATEEAGPANLIHHLKPCERGA